MGLEHEIHRRKGQVTSILLVCQQNYNVEYRQKVGIIRNLCAKFPSMLSNKDLFKGRG